MAAMPTRTSPWPAGVPCWVDLTVSDVPAAQAFYSAVLGWTFTEGDEEYGGYSIAQVDGAAAAGIGSTPQPGVPSAWTLYLSSTDVDATAKEIPARGGTMLLPPGDVGPLGRLCVASDPTGAVFGVWQAGTHIGIGLHSEPGGLTWEDLRSPDPSAAVDFYRAVFGYETHALEMAGPDYRTFHLPGDPAPLGGMGPMFGAPEGTPPHWLVYFGTTDVDAALAAARDAGGSQPMPPHDSPFGRMGSVTDPFGAVFVLVETDGSNAPDRGE
jgi:predicted enzyme related to lactoylglutathione lyase